MRTYAQYSVSCVWYVLHSAAFQAAGARSRLLRRACVIFPSPFPSPIPWPETRRCTGLAAMSTHLARIYDADGVSGISAADSQPAGGRSSLLSMEPPPPLASIGGLPVTASGGAISPTLTLAGPRTQSLTAVVSNHIALQVQALQQRESQQQLGGTSSGGAFAQPQHSLGTTSKSLLLSLIRRSASHGGAANGGAVGGGGTRENSGRSGAESGRRTRFADSVTVAALARASAAGGPPHHSSSGEVEDGECEGDMRTGCPKHLSNCQSECPGNCPRDCVVNM